MRIIELLTAIQTSLKAALPELYNCDLHGGRFDLKELNRIAARTPSIYIACLGSKALKDVATGESDLTLTLAAFVVTADKQGLPRLEGVINLAEAVLLHVTNNRFGLKGLSAGTNASYQNLYNGAIDKHGVALCSVTWEQTIRVGEDAFASTDQVFKDLYWGLDPQTGTGNENEYDHAGGAA